MTRFEIQLHYQKKGSKEPLKDTIHTFYGVDAEGNERIYSHLQSDEEFDNWKKTDRLWQEAQSALIDNMLSNPSTRDAVIQINLQAALEKDDMEMAVKLWNALSESTKAELINRSKSKPKS